MTQASPATGRPLVVFDFDHTLYDGDSGAHLVAWLVRRSRWRKALATLAAPLLLPMVAWLPTRRRGISGFLWIGTVGDAVPIEQSIDAYAVANAPSIRARLLAPALAVLHRHRSDGDEVVIATGAPPELARAILDFVAHQDLPVVGSLGRRCLGGYVTDEHCHAQNKMRMLRARGFGAVAMFRRVLPAGTPILNWGCKSRAGDHRVP